MRSTPRFASTRGVAGICLALSLALTACGEETEPGFTTGEQKDRLEAVEITGDVGEAPSLEWSGQMEAGGLETEVIVEGEGDEVSTDSQVIINYVLGNGFTQRETFSTYDEGGTSEFVQITPDFSPLFLAALDGQTIGSRVAVTGSAEEAFGSDAGNPELGIGNRDTVLLIMDINSGVLDAPEGTEQKAPAFVPAVGEKDGAVQRFGFKKTPEPTNELQQAATIVGDGAEVEEGDLIVVNYLGQTYDSNKPFDESYSGEPASFQIGTGNVIKGWDQGLVGQTVGSRVFLAIPPKLGYGKQGQEPDIQGDDTLYFVIDILGAG